MSGRQLALTGVPRSGTTLCCRLLGMARGTVALFEPMDVAWLPRVLWPFLSAETHARGRTVLRLRPFGPDLLVLRAVPDRTVTSRVLFRIEGGALSGRSGEANGRLEFREVLGGTVILAAIHDYRPRLPWWLYSSTQAVLHGAVMQAFGRHLARGRSDQTAPSRRPAKPEGA